MPPPARDQVFISYSHKDKDWLDKLHTTIKPLVRKGKISVWADTEIKPGAKWRDEITNALARAKVGVLLVSPDFLASEFIVQNELPPLLKAAKDEGATIFWIAVRHSMYNQTELGQYQSANDPSKPLASLSESDRDAELVRICEKIKAAVEP